MNILNIKNQKFDTDKLTEAAQAHIIHLKSVEFELDRLRMQQAIFQTAHGAYLRSLETEVAKTPEALIEITDDTTSSGDVPPKKNNKSK